MQLRDIRRNGDKLTTTQLTRLCKELDSKIRKAGFLTTVSIINSSRIDIKGGHSGVSNVYATINVLKRGHNYRVNSYTALCTKAGYKRTNVLTWEQRIELNNLINDVLDKNNISSQVEAKGGLVIRNKHAKGGVGTFYRAGGRVSFWEPPFESLAGDSFQPNFHDWIYNTPREAVAAFKAAYPTHFQSKVTANIETSLKGA